MISLLFLPPLSSWLLPLDVSKANILNRIVKFTNQNLLRCHSYETCQNQRHGHTVTVPTRTNIVFIRYRYIHTNSLISLEREVQSST